MEMARMQYMPGDPRLVDQLVYELKSKGIFDQFRKECIADVDTRPAYQNLRQRVESSVGSFLARQTWKPDLNKNQLREKLRKHLLDGNYLEQGVERIVDQVVNPKVASVFIPQVEDVVYNYLGIPRQKPATETVTSEKQDLLPTDLEAVSPGSVKSEEKDVKPDEIQMEIDESKDNSVMFVEEVKNEETRLSGISELTINDSESMDKSAIPLPAEEIKLENIPAPENSPPDIEKEKIDLKKINLPKEPNLSTDIPLPDEIPKIEKDNYFKPMILHSEDDSLSDSDSSLRRNMSPLTPIRNFLENSCDAQQGFENDSDDKSQDKIEPKTFRFTIEKTENGDETEVKNDIQDPPPYHFSNQVVNTFNTPNYDESSNSNNLQIDYESDLNSKSVDIKPEIEISEAAKKDKRDEKRSHKNSHKSREHKSSSKDRSHKSSRDSSRHDKDKKSSRNDKPRDKTSNDKSTDKKDSKDKDKHRSSSTHKSSHKDSHRSSSSSKHLSQEKDKRDNKKSSSSKEKSDKRDKERSSSKSSSHKSDRDRDRKSEKENRDKKKKKETDDHYSHSGRGNQNRRSTDRDSNDGSSSSKGTYNPSGKDKSTDSRKGSKSTSKSDNTSTSSNSDSPSDRERIINQAKLSKTPQKPVVKVDSLNMTVSSPSPSRLPFVPDVTLKKPRFASNMAEAKKMIKMRKFLEEEQKRMNQEAALLLEFQANVRPNLSQVYSSIPGPELEFACGSAQPTTQATVQDNVKNVQESVQNEAVIETYVEDPDTSYEMEISNDIIAETLLAMHREHGNRIHDRVAFEIATDDNIIVEGVKSTTTVASEDNIIAAGAESATVIATDDNIIVESVKSATTVASEDNIIAAGAESVTDDNFIASEVQTATVIATDENIIVQGVGIAPKDNIIPEGVGNAPEENITAEGVEIATKENIITNQSEISQGKEDSKTSITRMNDEKSESQDLPVNTDKCENQVTQLKNDIIDSQNITVTEDGLKTPENQIMIAETEYNPEIEDEEEMIENDNLVIDESSQDDTIDEDCSVVQNVTVIQNYQHISKIHDREDKLSEIQDNIQDGQNNVSDIQNITEIQHEKHISQIQDKQNVLQNSNEQKTQIQDVLEHKGTSEIQKIQLQDNIENKIILKENTNIPTEKDSESECMTLGDINVKEHENVFSAPKMSEKELQSENKESGQMSDENVKKSDENYKSDEESVQNIQDYVNETENVTQVAENVTQIAENKTQVAENMTQVAENVTQVAENMTLVAENVTQVAENMTQVTEKEDFLPPSEVPLQYFAEHEKFNSELERYKFDNFLKSYVEKVLKHKMFLINCDINKHNLIIEAAKSFGDYEIVNFCKNGHVKPKMKKKVVMNVNVTTETMLPTKSSTKIHTVPKTTSTKILAQKSSSTKIPTTPINTGTKICTNTTPKSTNTSTKIPTTPSTSKIFSPIFSPRSECSFELSSDYDMKLEEMVNKTSRQQVMEIILGGTIEDVEIPENPEIDVYSTMKDKKNDLKGDIVTNIPEKVIQTLDLGQKSQKNEFSVPKNVSETSKIDQNVPEKEKNTCKTPESSKIPEKVVKTTKLGQSKIGSCIPENDQNLSKNQESSDFDIEKELQVNIIDKDSCKRDGEIASLKRKIEELESETSNDNKKMQKPKKLKKVSESEEISSTTEDPEAVINKVANKSKYLGKARRVGLPKPKKPAALPNSPSSDKSVENYAHNATPQKNYEQNATPQKNYEKNATPQKNYEQNATPQKNYEQNATPQKNYEQNATPQKNPPNGKIKPTPRSKVQRYDTADLYKPKLHYLSRRNNVT